ncbi:hypothetical protein C8R43DRAFT_1102365 [Mycena crocata]|nr:hypothetical protein C8R43DRAFT_1102365 [Mycena crocata]
MCCPPGSNKISPTTTPERASEKDIFANYLSPLLKIHSVFSRGVGKPTASRLYIHAGSDTDELSPPDFFAVAPRLRDVRSKDWSYRLLTLPWEQLLRLKYEHGEVGHLSVGFDAMPLLSTHAHFELYVEVEYIIPPLVLQPKTFNIFAFTVEFDLYLASAFCAGDPRHSLRLSHVALADSQYCNFRSTTRPVGAATVLGFCDTSSLHDTLVYLSLRVLIEDAEFWHASLLWHRWRN